MDPHNFMLDTKLTFNCDLDLEMWGINKELATLVYRQPEKGKFTCINDYNQ